jgi:magnesium-transporting ATPase (P-type)
MISRMRPMGMSETDAKRKLEIYGQNVLKSQKKNTWAKQLFSQFLINDNYTDSILHHFFFYG